MILARTSITAALCVFGAALATCAAPDLNSPERFMKRPGHRMGGLPFPGVFTLYQAADPNKLGKHRYTTSLRFALPDKEQYRGIVYTCRAGFLDIAHIRKAVDWTKHFSVLIERALLEERESIALQGEEPSLFHMTFRYPNDWQALADNDRAALIHELSIRLGQRASYLLSTWHEIITWFGYKTTVIITEQSSAFTYDDIVSHLVGLQVADTAIRDRKRDYDDAVTHALDEHLKRLGVVSMNEAAEAIEQVKGLWWEWHGSKKRYLEIGVDGESIRPWIVRGLSFCTGDNGASFTAPTLDTIMSRDFSKFCEVQIEPRIIESNRIRSILVTRPKRIRPKDHFPKLMERIHAQMVESLGPEVNQPY